MLIGLAVCALTLAAQAHATTPSVGDLLNQVTVVPAVDRHPGYQRSCREGEGCVFGPAWNGPTTTPAVTPGRGCWPHSCPT